MGFHFAAAPAGLAYAVRAFWGFDDRSAGASGDERIVPDGCSEIVVHFGDPFSERDGGTYRGQPRALFAGQITRPLWLRATGPADVFAVRLQPHGARSLGLAPQWTLADTRIDLEDVLPKRLRSRWRETVDLLAAAGSFEARVETMRRFLEAALAGHAPDATSFCVAAISGDAAHCDLARIARSAGLSTRQMQRRFLADVGVTPKLFARIVRFQRAFEHGSADARDWARIAVECGYYDQPHLLRDFRQFAGDPPAALVAALAPLGSALVAAR